MTDPTTTSFGLLQLVVAALADVTSAGPRVFSPGDWQITPDECPYIRARVSSEDKQSLGRTAPQFLVTGTITLTLVVSEKAQLEDAGAAAADLALWTLQRQVEVAVINSYALTSQIQQFPFVRARSAYDAQGARHMGQLLVDIGVEFVQGVEDFCPVPTTELKELQLTADLVNVFDRTGNYDNPPFPDSVNPPPRAAGPDGRAEATVLLRPGELDFSDPDNSGLLPAL